ncbi:2-C-methyl-D-erythritol 4-phosphate cytidylyltransferase [Salinimonas marina]|uniref:2-C-methyl-D-erythritol 4-phosphate cytidylyltransferase n=1 Tax=Salinimonas marina TaxID=2785918 RepID=A0A7S9DWP6_9ALTE|nr:2-C-methyl-D-erythritol 4-phosphate cytidylyltransferase [Salinimonas marina]QPG05324.1 2-C-methyl-D-erythritol 4-phosphate cytidylyltransferase [Salinimonas marina]
MTQHPPIIAVVPAAGVGSRMQADRPKQYLTIHGKTVLEHTFNALCDHPLITRVVVAVSHDDPYFDALSVARAPWLTRVTGGHTRSESVLAATATLPDASWALVHDAARPCLSHKDIDALIQTALTSSVAGAILATPVRDTMKRAQPDLTEPALIAHTENREHLWHALTPQMFRADQLRAALEHAQQAGIPVTDEASAMEASGHAVALVDANPANIKITRPADMPLAQFYLSALHDNS